tara:strand:+ start:3716 stop:4906 length:1191 start_codon:yes stop_codon:yes gene_type:complete
VGIIDNIANFFRPQKEEKRHVNYFTTLNQTQNYSQDNALTFTAVWAAIRLLSESISCLPLSVYKKEKNGDKTELTEDPVCYLLKYRPNTYQNKVTFLEKIMTDLLLDGNSYVQIVRNRNGRPVELLPLKYANMNTILKDNRLFYHNEQVNMTMDSEDVLHFKLITDEDGYTGLSPIEQCKRAIAWGLDLEKYGKSFFENGAKLSGVLESDRSLSTEAIERLRVSFNDNYSKLKGANQTAVLEEGLKYKPIQISPDQAQWLNSRQFSIEEVCRIFNLPPHLLKDLSKSSFNNIEMQSQEFVSYTLMPYLQRIELEMNIKLFRKTEVGKKYVKFNVNGLLRGNIKDRAEFYNKMINSGVMSVNEVRAKEELNRVESGDKHITQMNMTTLEKIGTDASN